MPRHEHDDGHARGNNRLFRCTQPGRVCRGNDRDTSFRSSFPLVVPTAAHESFLDPPRNDDISRFLTVLGPSTFHGIIKSGAHGTRRGPRSDARNFIAIPPLPLLLSSRRSSLPLLFSIFSLPFAVLGTALSVRVHAHPVPRISAVDVESNALY